MTATATLMQNGQETLSEIYGRRIGRYCIFCKLKGCVEREPWAIVNNLHRVYARKFLYFFSEFWCLLEATGYNYYIAEGAPPVFESC